MQGRFWRIGIATLTLSVVLWGADPMIGTWKLNPAKSKDTARRIPTSLTDTYVAQDGGRVKLTRDEISDKARPTIRNGQENSTVRTTRTLATLGWTQWR
jgi:hypothetical protein